MNMISHLHRTGCCGCSYLLEDSCTFVVVTARRTNVCNGTFHLEESEAQTVLTVTRQGRDRAELRALLPELLVLCSADATMPLGRVLTNTR